MFDISIYEEASDKYKPDNIKVLFIVESPPFFSENDKPSYFFFENNPKGDVLFATIIYATHNIIYKKNSDLKKKLLLKFQKDKYWLIDAVEYPINKYKNGENRPIRERDKIIKKEVNNLLLRIKQCVSNNGNETKVILIKNNIYSLKPVLMENNFTVLNHDKIGFPRYYRDPAVVKSIRELLKLKY